MYYTFVALVVFIRISVVLSNGYIVYCPCMGRFGNQADHFLGALGFAKGLNRTLILPPWVEYRQGQLRSVQVPFNTYFKIEKLLEFHNVVTMEDFMESKAAEIWPTNERVAFCYTDRGGGKGCNAKEGNPFGPFWDTFNIDFADSELYGPLQFDVHHGNMSAKWQEKYSPSKWKVLAFVGAPASFPVQIENRDLHRHLEWSNNIQNLAKDFIRTKLPKGGFIGIHLRNGIDWVRACEHISHSPNLFSAPQCLGYRNEMGIATDDMCMPSFKTIVKHLKRVLRSMKDVASVFVASDSNHMVPELSQALKGFQVEVHKLAPANPHVDLAILGQAHHFIGNCISSFTAFVKRERDVRKLKTTFWSFPTEKKKIVHEDL